MAFKDWFKSLFTKRLPAETQAQEELDKVFDEGSTSAENAAFVEQLKDDNPVYDSSKSFVQKLNDLVVDYQKVESGIETTTGHRTYSDEDIMRIVLGYKLEREGISGIQAIELVKSISGIVMEQPFSWPVLYARDGKTSRRSSSVITSY